MTEEQIKEALRLASAAAGISYEFGYSRCGPDTTSRFEQQIAYADSALETYLRTIGEPESVNAELLEALKGMVDAHAIPSSYCKERPVYEQARAAIARAESAIESGPKPVSPDLLESARAVVARWDAPTWKDLPATAEYIGRLRVAIAREKESSVLLDSARSVLDNLERLHVSPLDKDGFRGWENGLGEQVGDALQDSIEGLKLVVGPCGGHAAQQEADGCK